jgi:hypothetical protein
LHRSAADTAVLAPTGNRTTREEKTKPATDEPRIHEDGHLKEGRDLGTVFSRAGLTILMPKIYGDRHDP